MSTTNRFIYSAAIVSKSIIKMEPILVDRVGACNSAPKVEVSFHCIVIPSALDCEGTEDTINLLDLFRRQLDVRTTQVLQCTLLLRRARERDDVRPELSNPGDRKLCGGYTLLLGERRERAHELQVVIEILQYTVS
jgi:hypothetical protein